MLKPERHVWEEGSTHRAVAGKEYDEVWEYAEALERALNYCYDDTEVMQNAAEVRVAALEAELRECEEVKGGLFLEVVALEARVQRLTEALGPLAYAIKSRWHNADSSTEPYVVTEGAVKRAKEALDA